MSVLGVPVDGTDDCLVSEEHDSSVRHNPEEMCTHPSIQTTHTFIGPHLEQCLEEGVVFTLIPGYLLS